jgi:hypothetical protein
MREKGHINSSVQKKEIKSLELKKQKLPITAYTATGITKMQSSKSNNKGKE